MRWHDQCMLARANELRQEAERFLAIAMKAKEDGDLGYVQMLTARANEYFEHAAAVRLRASAGQALCPRPVISFLEARG